MIRKTLLIATTLLSVSLTGCLTSSIAKETKHKFIVTDEPRKQLHYIDSNNQQNNWTLKLPAKYRDMQFIGDNKLLVSTDNGYKELDFKTRKTLKEVRGVFYGTTSAQRLANGETIIATNQKNGVNFFKLNKADKIIKRINFPKYHNIRLMRLTKDGKIMFGCNNNHVVITDFSKKIYTDIKIPGAKHIYQVIKLQNNNILVANGYGENIVEVNLTTKKVIKEYGGKKHPQAKVLGFHFFSGMQVLPNGNIVVANWTGHGKNDSQKGAQLIEFSKDNTVVWSWKNSKKAGSIHHVIILNPLNLNKLNNEFKTVLGK